MPCQQAGLGQNFSEQWMGPHSFGMHGSPALGGPTPVPPPPPPSHAAGKEQQVPGNIAGAGSCLFGQQPLAAPIGLAVAAQQQGPPLFQAPTNTTAPIGAEAHDRAPDANMLKTIEDAVASAYSRMQKSHVPSAPTTAPADHSGLGSRSGQSDAGGLEELRSDCRRLEERARKAEERTRRLEDELDDMKQQQRREVNSLQMLRQEFEQQMQTLRRESQQQVQSLRQQLSDDRLLMSTVQRDLDQERHLRCSLEARVSENSGTLQEVLRAGQNALRVAEGAQQDVRQMRQERTSDADSLGLAVRMVENSTRERLDALECKMEKGHLDLLRTGSTPAKINFLQGLHAMQTGRRFGGGSNGAALKDFAEADAPQRSQGAARPLMRNL